MATKWQYVADRMPDAETMFLALEIDDLLNDLGYGV